MGVGGLNFNREIENLLLKNHMARKTKTCVEASSGIVESILFKS